MTQVNDNTKLDEFFSTLAGGVQKQILEMMLTKVAKGVLQNGAKGRKGKITIDITMGRLNDEEGNDGLKVESKIAFNNPTKRGSATEDEKRESVLYLTPTGLSDTPARLKNDEEGTEGVSLKSLGMPQQEGQFIPASR